MEKVIYNNDNDEKASTEIIQIGQGLYSFTESVEKEIDKEVNYKLANLYRENLPLIPKRDRKFLEELIATLEKD